MGTGQPTDPHLRTVVLVTTGADLLDELHDALVRYVVLPSLEATTAVVLWITATHGLSAFEHATRLAINSPVKRCGKSRLLEVIQATAFNTVPTTNISVPALFRMIDAAAQPPTLILDEADRLFGSAKKDEENRDLIAILNNGFREGSPTWRCVGPSQVPTPFSNYAMVALAGIGRKPDTIEDRAVNIEMRRRMPGEVITKFRLRTDLPALHDLRDRLGEWVSSVSEVLEVPVTDLPAGLEDRAEDAWEPLLAVASAAGGHWPQRAHTAAVKLTQDVDDDDQSDVRILADVRTTFKAEGDLPFLPSVELLTGLRQIEDAPWSDFDLTTRKLATKLTKFGVKPRPNPAGTVRGYYRKDLQDAFRRYLPSDPSEASEMPTTLEKRPDGLKSSDTSNRQTQMNRQTEQAAQTPNLTGLTLPTDTPPECRVCGHPPIRSGSFGLIACEHQLAEIG